MGFGPRQARGALARHARNREPLGSAPAAGSRQRRAGAGPRAGRGVGEALASVESWWRGEDFVPGREACLARLREAVAHARADNAATARCGV